MARSYAFTFEGDDLSQFIPAGLTYRVPVMRELHPHPYNLDEHPRLSVLSEYPRDFMPPGWDCVRRTTTRADIRVVIKGNELGRRVEAWAMPGNCTGNRPAALLLEMRVSLRLSDDEICQIVRDELSHAVSQKAAKTPINTP